MDIIISLHGYFVGPRAPAEATFAHFVASLANFIYNIVLQRSSCGSVDNDEDGYRPAPTPSAESSIPLQFVDPTALATWGIGFVSFIALCPMSSLLISHLLSYTQESSFRNVTLNPFVDMSLAAWTNYNALCCALLNIDRSFLAHAQHLRPDHVTNLWKSIITLLVHERFTHDYQENCTSYDEHQDEPVGGRTNRTAAERDGYPITAHLGNCFYSVAGGFPTVFEEDETENVIPGRIATPNAFAVLCGTRPGNRSTAEFATRAAQGVYDPVTREPLPETPVTFLATATKHQLNTEEADDVSEMSSSREGRGKLEQTSREGAHMHETLASIVETSQRLPFPKYTRAGCTDVQNTHLSIASSTGSTQSPTSPSHVSAGGDRLDLGPQLSALDSSLDNWKTSASADALQPVRQISSQRNDTAASSTWVNASLESGDTLLELPARENNGKGRASPKQIGMCEAYATSADEHPASAVADPSIVLCSHTASIATYGGDEDQQRIATQEDDVQAAEAAFRTPSEATWSVTVDSLDLGMNFQHSTSILPRVNIPQNGRFNADKTPNAHELPADLALLVSAECISIDTRPSIAELSTAAETEKPVIDYLPTAPSLIASRTCRSAPPRMTRLCASSDGEMDWLSYSPPLPDTTEQELPELEFPTLNVPVSKVGYSPQHHVTNWDARNNSVAWTTPHASFHSMPRGAKVRQHEDQNRQRRAIIQNSSPSVRFKVARPSTYYNPTQGEVIYQTARISAPSATPLSQTLAGNLSLPRGPIAPPFRERELDPSIRFRGPINFGMPPHDAPLHRFVHPVANSSHVPNVFMRPPKDPIVRPPDAACLFIPQMRRDNCTSFQRATPVHLSHGNGSFMLSGPIDQAVQPLLGAPLNASAAPFVSSAYYRGWPQFPLGQTAAADPWVVN